MPTYLLPCSCGRKIPIEPRQAGQEVYCACGKISLAPTWREMAALEQSEEVAAAGPPRAGWGGPERFIFLGAVLAAGSLAGAAVVYWCRPPAHLPPPTPAEIENAAPAQTVAMFYWLMATGLDDGSQDKGYQAYLKQVARYRLALGVVGVGAAAGLVLLGLGLLARRRAPKPGAATRDADVTD